jgi:dTDP-4-dehydrorhamnose reductase
MKIILFGSTGMLGNYVKSLLSHNFEVICILRNDFDIESNDWDKLYEILKLVDDEDIIINCAGAIPQKDCPIRKYISLNTLFPFKLAEIIKDKNNCKLIHITTDCVFSGRKGTYYENDIHDAEDIYGISKSLGEPSDACIIRTSIIGEELYGKKSLIEWLKSNKNGIIEGYDKFYWNGITCLEVAKIIENIINNNSYWKGVRHFYSNTLVSKYQLCSIINDVYDLNMNIHKNETIVKNMTLQSKITEPREHICELIKAQHDYIFETIH